MEAFAYCGDCQLMKSLFLVWLCVLGMLAPALAEEPWAGTWQLTWPQGGTFVQLTQEGDTIRGSYRYGRGEVEAAVVGNRVDGKIIQGGVSETFSATLSPDKNSFSGKTETGDWLSGIRTELGSTNTHHAPPDLSSPRATLLSLLNAANLARQGQTHALAIAVDTIKFDDDPEWSSIGPKFLATQQLFHLIDVATFPLASIPNDSPGPQLTISLPVLGKQSPVPLNFERGADGTWLIVMPSPDTLRTLLEEHEQAISAADAYRTLASPRDTVRTFFEGMARWDSGGRTEVLTTLDLSEIPDVLKAEQGAMSAQYLIRAIDRAGPILLQSVPNSGARQLPFIYFENPAGQIVIEPIGTGAEARWQFSADTVRNARSIFAAVQSVPKSHTLYPGLIPPSVTFAMREKVEAYAPALLRDVAGNGRVEYWQVMVALLTVTVMIGITLILRKVTVWLVSRRNLSQYVPHPKRFALTIAIIPAFIFGSQVVPSIGLPASTRQFTLPVMGSLMVVFTTYAAWQLISIIATVLDELAQKTKTEIDNILVTFVSGLARLSIVATAGLALGKLWSLPTSGILAGLGIGGIAVAFASKETIANVFGAGILLGDRPFRKGDRITSGNVSGWVEAVGLRSTRIRTLDDSLVIVPNSKLADSMIDNLGMRRRRSFAAKVTVTAGSTPEKLQAFTNAIAARIGSDPLFDQYAEVNISGITASGIDVEIMALLNTIEGHELRATAHRLYIDIMKLAVAEGLTLGRGTEKNPVYVLQEA
jgi:MscS family membrane protein